MNQQLPAQKMKEEKKNIRDTWTVVKMLTEAGASSRAVPTALVATGICNGAYIIKTKAKTVYINTSLCINTAIHYKYRWADDSLSRLKYV